MATAGDVNGSGYDDVIVGAPDYSNGQTGEGAAFVYHGSAAGLNQTPNWMVESNKEYAAFGTSVATAGDVNGDGFDDIIIGAARIQKRREQRRAVFVYYGSKTSRTQRKTSRRCRAKPAAGLADRVQPSRGANFGTSVTTAGDVNGDGYDDVIVGAPDYSNGQTGEGAAFVYYGSVAGVSTTASWIAELNQPNAVFGTSVATAGDVNGDGYADVIIGAPGYEKGEVNEGAAFVYHGRKAGLETTANWMVESDQVNAESRLVGAPPAT